MNKPTSPGPWFFVEPSKMYGRQYKDWVITYGDGHNWVCLGPVRLTVPTYWMRNVKFDVRIGGPDDL